MAATISKEEPTQDGNASDSGPEADSNVISGGFFATGGLQSVVSDERLAHYICDQFGKWKRTPVSKHGMVELSVKPCDKFYHQHNLRVPTGRPKCSFIIGLVDTGTQMCVAGEDFLSQTGNTERDLYTPTLKARVANNQNLELLGVVSVILRGQSPGGLVKETGQLVYVARGLRGFFICKDATRALGIISLNFPKVAEFDNIEKVAPANEQVQVKHDGSKGDGIPNPRSSLGTSARPLPCRGECGCPIRELPPEVPDAIPFPPVIENVSKLKEWILERYKSSSFNVCPHQPLPLVTSSPPMRLYMEESARPVAIHKAPPVPVHWEAQVKEAIDRDVALGVLEWVPPDNPTTWCSRMVTASKKDGKPRRVVDLRALNKYAVRQTHPVKPPFLQASRVPPHTWRSTMDAWNGYHSIPLAEEDRHLTTFLTPWGRLRYRVLPQGYLAAGDAYTHRYDQVTRDFPHPFMRCVDDCLPWTNSIEDMFFVVCEYLTLTGNHGIIQSPSKFVFCQKELEFVGFWLGEDSIKPFPDTLQAITEFPRPTNITDIRSFFSLLSKFPLLSPRLQSWLHSGNFCRPNQSSPGMQ